MQVVKAMEAAGAKIDRERIGAVLSEIISRQREAEKRRGIIRPRPPNAALERFKFWLGLPNRYYESDWRTPDSSTDSDVC